MSFTPPPPDHGERAVGRAFGALLMGVGGLIMGLSGLCSVTVAGGALVGSVATLFMNPGGNPAAIIAALPIGLASMAGMVAVVGGIPFFLGWAIFRWGRGLRKPSGKP